jgi:hypothetical protein
MAKRKRGFCIALYHFIFAFLMGDVWQRKAKRKTCVKRFYGFLLVLKASAYTKIGVCESVAYEVY